LPETILGISVRSRVAKWLGISETEGQDEPDQPGQINNSSKEQEEAKKKAEEEAKKEQEEKIRVEKEEKKRKFNAGLKALVKNPLLAFQNPKKLPVLIIF
jgi:hypothetical protein